MDFCDCVDNFKLTGGWQIIFKNIAKGPALGDSPNEYMEYNQYTGTFALATIWGEGFDTMVITPNNTDLDMPKPKYIYRSGGNAIENLNFKAPQ